MSDASPDGLGRAAAFARRVRSRSHAPTLSAAGAQVAWLRRRVLPAHGVGDAGVNRLGVYRPLGPQRASLIVSERQADAQELRLAAPYYGVLAEESAEQAPWLPEPSAPKAAPLEPAQASLAMPGAPKPAAPPVVRRVSPLARSSVAHLAPQSPATAPASFPFTVAEVRQALERSSAPARPATQPATQLRDAPPSSAPSVAPSAAPPVAQRTAAEGGAPAPSVGASTASASHLDVVRTSVFPSAPSAPGERVVFPLTGVRPASQVQELPARPVPAAPGSSPRTPGEEARAPQEAPAIERSIVTSVLPVPSALPTALSSHAPAARTTLEPAASPGLPEEPIVTGPAESVAAEPGREEQPGSPPALGTPSPAAARVEVERILPPAPPMPRNAETTGPASVTEAPGAPAPISHTEVGPAVRRLAAPAPGDAGPSAAHPVESTLASGGEPARPPVSLAEASARGQVFEMTGIPAAATSGAPLDVAPTGQPSVVEPPSAALPPEESFAEEPELPLQALPLEQALALGPSPEQPAAPPALGQPEEVAHIAPPVPLPGRAVPPGRPDLSGSGIEPERARPTGSGDTSARVMRRTPGPAYLASLNPPTPSPASQAGDPSPSPTLGMGDEGVAWMAPEVGPTAPREEGPTPVEPPPGETGSAFQGIPLEEALFGPGGALASQGVIRRVPLGAEPPPGPPPPGGPSVGAAEEPTIEPGGPALQVNVVRRSVQIDEMTSSVETTESGARPGEGQSPGGQGVNLEQLTEQVYRLIRQRLRVEREREGDGVGNWR